MEWRITRIISNNPGVCNAVWNPNINNQSYSVRRVIFTAAVHSVIKRIISIVLSTNSGQKNLNRRSPSSMFHLGLIDGIPTWYFPLKKIFQREHQNMNSLCNRHTFAMFGFPRTLEVLEIYTIRPSIQCSSRLRR